MQSLLESLHPKIMVTYEPPFLLITRLLLSATFWKVILGVSIHPTTRVLCLTDRLRPMTRATACSCRGRLTKEPHQPMDASQKAHRQDYKNYYILPSIDWYIKSHITSLHSSLFSSYLNLIWVRTEKEIEESYEENACNDCPCREGNLSYCKTY